MNSNLILHIPHASDNIPDRTGYVVTDDVLKQEMLLLTDWYTDDLFSFGGGITCIADFNRVFCDTERFADDKREVMSTVGMGVTYTKCDDGAELRKVSPELKAQILDKYYYPHHESLTAAVDEQINLHGRALIVDCHSFSSKPFKRDLNQAMPRPDFCIGTDDFHTPRGLFKYAAVVLKVLGYTVSINTPYTGSIVPEKYYQVNKRVSSIMIEINRDLYLIPGTNEKSVGYDKVKLDTQKLLSGISKNKFDFDKVLPLVKGRNE
jgi:N-formylglutamate deformylase